MLHVRRPVRPRRVGEWTGDKAVTFIVTLAASCSVTLAARQAGMSRKSAYALRARDPAFAAAWDKAIQASALRPRQGDKVKEVHEAPDSPRHGDVTVKFGRLSFDGAMRDLFFDRLAERTGDSAKLAARSPAQ